MGKNVLVPYHTPLSVSIEMALDNLIRVYIDIEYGKGEGEGVLGIADYEGGGELESKLDGEKVAAIK